MRILSVFLLVTSAAFAVDAPSLSGKWQIHASISGNDSDYYCSFTQKAADLTGNCDSSRGAVQISGKVAEKSASWAYKTEYNGAPLTVSFAGKLESDSKITGTITAEEYGVSGEFTAVKK